MIIELAFSLTAAWAATPGQNPAHLCRRNTSVEVLWEGRWYPASVNADGPAQGLCPIHYMGYGASWDEAVSADRLRPAPAPTGKGGAPSAAYEAAVACVGLIQRLGVTMSDQAARTEATDRAASLAGGSFRLGRQDGKSDVDIQADIDSAIFAGELLIPTTDQREATAALERVAPAAQECLVLEGMLTAPS